MTPLDIHLLIAEIARLSLEIKKINKSDKLCYSKRIEVLSDDIFKRTAELHEEFFPGYIDRKDK